MDGWTLNSPHLGRRAFRAVASCDTDRARTKWLWDLALAKTAEGAPIRTESGDIVNEPSYSELTPDVSREDLESHSSFPPLGAYWNNSGHG